MNSTKNGVRLKISKGKTMKHIKFFFLALCKASHAAVLARNGQYEKAQALYRD
jgi:hypothetical protein